MSPSIPQIILLALIQGAAELLPVSSSAHVIVAEKLMHLDAASPEMLFLMIMLHTGTMFAVIVYFWSSWKKGFFSSVEAARSAFAGIVYATLACAVVMIALKELIEKVVLHGRPGAAVEDLTGNLPLMAGSLAIAGLFIISAGQRAKRTSEVAPAPVSGVPAALIGLVQGISLPFRGMSRSGTTISAGMLLGVHRRAAEEFSFALAVVITPPIIAREFLRFYKSRAASGQVVHLASLAAPGIIGMVLSFIAGLAALRWLSRWLENGRWHYFGFYCLAASAAVAALARMGY